MSQTQPSLLSVVINCDNFVVSNTKTTPEGEKLISWRLSPEPSSPVLGLLRPSVVAQLKLETSELWYFVENAASPYVSLSASLDTPSKRTRAMKELCERWRDIGLWPNQIGPRKWRAEMYPIFRNPFGKHDAPVSEKGEVETGDDSTNYAFMMERAACALFGVVTYGVHMTVYEDSAEGASSDTQSYRFWVPKRAQTKQTWPGFLDNSVAGGIPSGLGIFESVVKESYEEASIPEDIVRQRARATGVVSYFHRTTDGWLQPEVEYVYELRIPSSVPLQLKPSDGEVESFELLELSEVEARVRAGLFKPNCALVFIDFMINHGYITADNEPDFLEIVTRLHGRFDYEKW
ncbi:hypothetical protein QCA50_014143 [Cerrena zonata]|uniref:Nudix hydrolase domain-containing protein n=1 Tax=Cerrena zonata TaxID=2478898 RepID=A0AAW0FV63_9APHY